MSRLINDWNNETNLEFLRLYFKETVLWDPRQRHHKERAALNDAWSRLGVAMKTSVAELKKKRESLMATFRSHVRKKKAATQYNETYNPTWFAYDLMESFLGPVYDVSPNMLDNDNSLECMKECDEEGISLSAEDSGSLVGQPVNEASASGSPSMRQPAKKRRKGYERDFADTAVFPGGGGGYDNGTYSPLPHSSIAHHPHDPYPPDDDESDLFCRLLAKKLRKLPETEREMFMYQIDGMFINRMRQMNRPPSPTLSYSVPSPTVQHSVE